MRPINIIVNFEFKHEELIKSKHCSPQPTSMCGNMVNVWRATAQHYDLNFIWIHSMYKPTLLACLPQKIIWKEKTLGGSKWTRIFEFATIVRRGRVQSGLTWILTKIWHYSCTRNTELNDYCESGQAPRAKPTNIWLGHLVTNKVFPTLEFRRVLE